MDKDVHAKIPLSGLGDKNTHEFNGKGCDYDHIAKELGFGAFFFFLIYCVRGSMSRLDDKMQEPVLCFHPVAPKDQIQIVLAGSFTC